MRHSELQPPREIMAELFGKKTGICRGQGGSMHMFSAEWGLVSASLGVCCITRNTCDSNCTTQKAQS